MKSTSYSFPCVCSNTRIKEYPSFSVLQVANSNLFRDPAFEPQKREYSVSSKGNAKDPERSLESSRARARAAVRDIALCNHFTYFFTWTLDPDLINRYDADKVLKAVQTFLKNSSRRKNFEYVCVPELHEDGAIHFHGFCNLGDVRISPAINPYTGKPMFTNRNQQIFNMVDWRLGFSTCIPIDEHYERACNYLTKYLSKGKTKIFGKWYFCSRHLRKKPDIEFIAFGSDFDEFREQYPFANVSSIYNDVMIASQKFDKDGLPCE